MWRRTYLALATALAAALLSPTPAVAEAAPPGTVVPIHITGDPAKRFNIVVVGDGYTAADLPKFRQHLDKHMNVLLTVEPFKSYANYLNIYAVEVPSTVSGVSCDPDLTSARRDTPLGMGFWGGCDSGSVQRLLTVDNAALTRYANLVPGTTSANRQLLAIANSDTYGGAGGTYATASGGNALSALITPHELGHSLGGLDDEYDYYSRGVRGGTYTGGEPDSVHHTVLTEQQMTEQHQKWWRWLGDPSESGGTIGRYESGLYSGKGVYRPSAHSMMKTLGYAFDQVSRERMTQRISGKTNVLENAAPNTASIGADRIVWVEPLHPVSHSLTVGWTVDGKAVAGGRDLDLAKLGLTPGRHTLVATVSDPTPFVRDPAVRASMSRSRMWTVETAVTTPRVPTPAEFTASTSPARPVSAGDVLYVETSHPVDTAVPVTWTLDGISVPEAGKDLDLKRFSLTGRHTVSATIPGHALSWTVDAALPDASYELSKPLLTVAKPGQPAEYVFNAPFTMRLNASDDTPGYAVREFRTDGDGWYNYFGWPSSADQPFLFTAEGTNIDNLVYGKLGKPRLSPWDEVPPGYGKHTIEYRAVDPVGNIGRTGSFAATLLPSPPPCTTSLTGHTGPLVVSTGVTCLSGLVAGPIVVRPGASLVATDATIAGPVSASGATSVQLLNTAVAGPVHVTASTGDVILAGGRVAGPVSLSGNPHQYVVGR